MLRYLRFLIGIAVFLILAPFAYADAPMAQAQIPGYYRIQLGQFEVTALYVGSIELHTNLLKNTTAVELQRLLSRMFVGNPKMQTAVNVS